MGWKIFILAAVVIFSVSWAQDNYTLKINGQPYDLGLDKAKSITLPDGTTLELELAFKEYVAFESRYCGFLHKNTYRPNTTDLGEGIYQTTIMTALGSGILVQEYTTFDPSTLIDLMIKELTKEEIDYGYEYQEREIVRQVAGVEMKGKEVITSYKEDEYTRCFLAYGKRDEGIFVITFSEKADAAEAQALIDKFWSSLKVKL